MSDVVKNSPMGDKDIDLVLQEYSGLYTTIETPTYFFMTLSCTEAI